MAFCGNCGTQAQDGVKFCPSCGQSMGAAPNQAASTATATQEPPIYTPPVMPGAPQQADIRDAQEGKTMSILAYILFFIPLLTGAHKTSPFVKYHTNQGTVLFIVAIAYSIISGILRAVIRVPVSVYGYSTGVFYTPGWLSTILWLISIPICILCIVGIINAVNGRMKPLPLIGGITIIK